MLVMRSYRHRRLDRRLRRIALESNVVVGEIEQAFPRRIEFEPRQGARRARQLQPRLFDMIGIKMGVAECVDEIADLQAASLRHQMGQQRVRGDIERHAEENIGGTLVELAGQATQAVDFRDIELEQAMAGRQSHALDLGRIPGRDDETPRKRIVFDFIHQPGDLVIGPPVGAGPGTPLLAIDRAKIALFIGPFVPDAHAILLEIGDIGVAAQKPQQFMDDGFGVQLFRRQQRKAGGKIETQLRAENGGDADAGAVAFGHALGHDALEKIEIGPHG